MDYLSDLITSRSDFYMIRHMAITDFNNEVITVASAELCAAECVARTSYVCRSFDFHFSSGACYMSEENEKTQSAALYANTNMHLFVRISK